MYDKGRALELLRAGTGIPNAQFREGQENAIRHVVEGQGKLLVVQKTGWGKSFVYFIATKLLREAGFGPTLLISPLLSLMRNQIASADRMEVTAGAIHSGNRDEHPSIEAQLYNDDLDILLVTPERLTNNDFRNRIFPTIAERISLVVVDEVHCISDWGHDFRPEYQYIARMTKVLPDNLRLLGTTATANDRVMRDLTNLYDQDAEILRGDLSRPSLSLQTIVMPSQSDRLAWLSDRMHEIPGSGIIYALTTRDCEQIALWLQSEGFAVEPYTARSPDREQLEIALQENRVKALVATTALGMGFDKPNLTFVIHYQTPASVVHYYQQVGRAGRSVDAAYGVLLSGSEDTEITDYFINNAFPDKEEVRQIISALEREPNGLSVPQLLREVNIKQSRVDKAIELLALELPAPIAKQGPKWQLTAANLNDSFWERAERLTALRHDEQREMQDYVSLKSGHMEFLITALDGDPTLVETPDLPPLATEAKRDTGLRAVEFLRRTNVPIVPRKQWPAGGMPQFGWRGNIKGEQQAQAGRALCYWGDAAWGRMVRAGKYQKGKFSDELVKASVELIRDWSPEPFPSWVTCIPSLQRTELVPDFANRLASELGLPFTLVLEKTESRSDQKAMANNIQQALNLDGSLKVMADQIPSGPVLLVDDMTDSGWTFTVAAALLLDRGCQAVFPFALADAGNRRG